MKIPKEGWLALALLLITGSGSAKDDEDPFLWLEDAHGTRAMEWVRKENAKTVQELDGDRLFPALFQKAKSIIEATDRIPQPEFLNGRIYNLWQDADHPHGLWRQTSLDDYRSATPHWQTVLDLDALSKRENGNWFWAGASCEEPAETRCLLALSDGGEDATTVREFDLSTASFVSGGFVLPKSKQSAAWEDHDTLLVAREWKPGELTQSGYAYVAKRLKRGQSLETAAEVFRGKAQDTRVDVFRMDDGSGHHAVLLNRGVTFFATERFLVGPNGPARLNLPQKLDVLGLVENQVVVTLNEDWNTDGKRLAQGSVVSLDLTEATNAPARLRPTLIYSPSPRQAFVEARTTKHRLLVHVLDNVNARAAVYERKPDGSWAPAEVSLPSKAAIDLGDADFKGGNAFFTVTGFLNPTRLQLLDINGNQQSTVKQLPARFDTGDDIIEQFAATSKDGTQVPYFIVHRGHAASAGQTPTILEAYGGFLVPMTPYYSPVMGRLWLERGGSFVLANIRGGGEFGPRWHDAGLKTHRQRIYDDFVAVAQDLIRRGFTDSAHLGIVGGSNGGLLMGVEFTQHPELYAAVQIQIPLLDMLRFEQIAAGASWVDEYGSVSKPEERQFLSSISPYNNLKPATHYPRPFIWSTTKDDRVGPQHARKFAAKLAEMGVPYLYYEVIEGGHSDGATPTEQAEMSARQYTYFSRQLHLEH